MGFLLSELPNIALGLAWILLAIVAAFFNTGDKRAICFVYAFGVAVGCVIYLEYQWFGVFDDLWRHFYVSLIWIDIIVLLALKYLYFHGDYIWIRRIIFLTLAVNATILAEWAYLKTDYMFLQREEALNILNWTLLLILYGNSDGNLRIMDDVWASILGRRIKHTLGVLRLDVGPP